nr:O-antigen ligase family protein [Actinomycetota bacterium]
MTQQDRQRAAEARAARRLAHKGAIPLAILSFPLLLSGDLTNISPTFDAALKVAKVISTLIVVFLYINRLMSRKPAQAHIMPMALVMLALLVSTAVNSGSFDRYFTVWGGFFAVALLVDANIRERPIPLLLALKVVLGLITVVNAATVLAFPEGIWRIGDEGFWLLGHRNNFGTPLVAAIVVSAAYDFISRRRLTFTTVVIGVAAFVSVLRTWSASSVVAVAAAIIVVLLASFSKRGLRILKPLPLLIGYAALDIGIVLFQVQDEAKGFITDVLDRSTDLTGRTRIWSLVMDMVQKSPLFGNGVQLTQNNGLTVYNPNFVHAHNGELDILMNGGYLAFIPYVVMMILTAVRAAKSYQNRTVQILYIGLIIMMVRAITGLFFSAYTVLLVFLLLNAEMIVQKSDEFVLPSDQKRSRMWSRLTDA